MTRTRSVRSIAAEAAFRARVAELGAELIEPQWLGNGAPHRVRCAAGHECAPRPAGVQQGQGICGACAGNSASATEARFRALLAELGAEVLGPYLGVHRPIRVRCAAGHVTTPPPSNLMAGRGCAACTGHDPAFAEVRFRARLAELGAELLEPSWLGMQAPHRVRCSAGHDCFPRPGNLSNGQGLCRLCVGKLWDVFYVVADQGTERIKFGITSGDPRRRLGYHRAAGYREIVRLFTGLPGAVAPEIERAVLGALVLAEVRPVKGREYYDASALALVLDVADNYPIGVTLSGE